MYVSVRYFASQNHSSIYLEEVALYREAIEWRITE